MAPLSFHASAPLPQHLKAYGYRTLMAGKWHLGHKAPEYLPTRRGFDRFYGFYTGIMDYWGHYNDAWGGARALDLHEGAAGAAGPDVPLYNTSGTYSTHLFAAKAVEWVREHATAHPGAPLFLYLALQACHSANGDHVQAPPDAIRAFAAISPDETCGPYEATRRCSAPAARKTCAACVADMDAAVGRVVRALREARMWDNTLLVFSTDNGGPADFACNNMMNNFPLRGCKGGYYEGGVRGVGLVHGPGIAPGARRGLHHVADWLPTLLTAARRGLPGAARAAPHEPPLRDGDAARAPRTAPHEPPFRDGDGVDNWGFVSRGGPSARRELLHVTQAPGSRLKSHALRVGDLKLVWRPAQSDCSLDHAGWYPPPDRRGAGGVLPWNYTRFAVRCGEPPQLPPAALLTQCTAAPCLFNITADPCEHRDLAEARPDDVRALEGRLAQYQAHAVLPACTFPEPDPRADPGAHGPVRQGYEGLWAPWMTDEEAHGLYPDRYPGFPRDPDLGRGAGSADRELVTEAHNR